MEVGAVICAVGTPLVVLDELPESEPDLPLPLHDVLKNATTSIWCLNMADPNDSLFYISWRSFVSACLTAATAKGRLNSKINPLTKNGQEGLPM